MSCVTRKASLFTSKYVGRQEFPNLKLDGIPFFITYQLWISKNINFCHNSIKNEKEKIRLLKFTGQSTKNVFILQPKNLISLKTFLNLYWAFQEWLFLFCSLLALLIGDDGRSSIYVISCVVNSSHCMVAEVQILGYKIHHTALRAGEGAIVLLK